MKGNVCNSTVLWGVEASGEEVEESESSPLGLGVLVRLGAETVSEPVNQSDK